MTDEPETNLLNLWQEQPTQPVVIDLKELHMRAETFQSKLFWRNTREYIASGLTALVFGAFLIIKSDAIVRTGFLLSLCGIAFYVFILHTRGRADREGLIEAGEDCLNFHRKALTRQRDLVRSAWLWGILPMIPGPALFLWREAVLHPSKAPTFAVMAGIIAVGFAGLAWLNIWVAGRMQKRLDELG